MVLTHEKFIYIQYFDGSERSSCLYIYETNEKSNRGEQCALLKGGGDDIFAPCPESGL